MYGDYNSSKTSPTCSLLR